MLSYENSYVFSTDFGYQRKQIRISIYSPIALDKCFINDSHLFIEARIFPFSHSVLDILVCDVFRQVNISIRYPCLMHQNSLLRYIFITWQFPSDWKITLFIYFLAHIPVITLVPIIPPSVCKIKHSYCKSIALQSCLRGGSFRSLNLTEFIIKHCLI